jgi:hypothetical protein
MQPFTVHDLRGTGSILLNESIRGPPKLVRQHAHRAESLRLRPFGAGMVQPIAQ